MSGLFDRFDPPASRLFLLGFMGAGKTVCGRLLADRLACAFVDLDARIEAAAGQSVAAIFSSSGEAAFRDLEFSCLSRLPEPSVVALGGGAFIQDRVRERLPELGRSLYLAWPFEVLWSRISGDTRRPLARDKVAVRALFHKREPIYRQADRIWEAPIGQVPSPEDVATELHELVVNRV